MLKVNFRELHCVVVEYVHAANIIDFLFQNRILDHQDASVLQRQDDPQQQCRYLLLLLHTSENPSAFVELWRAVKREPYLQWLVDRIEDQLIRLDPMGM